MTDYYVKSGTGGTGGLTWADAMDTVAAAIALGVAAGDRIFVSQSHTETAGGNLTWVFPLSGAPVQVICVDDTGSPEPPLDSDVLTTPTAQINVNTYFGYVTSINGRAFFSGLAFSDNGGYAIGSAALNSSLFFRDCSFSFAASSNQRYMVVGNASNATYNSKVTFERCSFVSNQILSGFRLGRVNLSIIDCTYPATVSPSTLFQEVGLWSGCMVNISGFDISAINAPILTGNNASIHIRATGLITHAGSTLQSSINSASSVLCTSFGTSSGKHAIAFADYLGELATDTGIYLNATLSGTAASYNLSCTDATLPAATPFRVELTTIDSVDFSSSKTFTVEMARDGSATEYQNDEVWVEVEYNDITDTALRVTDNSSRCALLATPSNWTASSASWTGLNATNNKGKIAVTISSSVAATGPVRIFVCFATGSASTDLYVDPAITVA